MTMTPDDQPTTSSDVTEVIDRTRRLTLAEAAPLAGLTLEALRLRVRRRRLPAKKDNEGRITVALGDVLDLRPRGPTKTGPSSPAVPDDAADALALAEADLAQEQEARLRAEADRDGERRRAESAEARVRVLEEELREGRTPLLLRLVRAWRRTQPQ
ncbi:hypothetical protein EAH89_29780 [Roseomonas nepalensis]|uniref:Uncharacterized protein n=1 Tax=Muricoccus nepalensis TaxID=1854500 RepID=A0A502EN59_9PROT|nr:hypothetical protein EAH89_29780 [Roseomonas nepalensis]